MHALEDNNVNEEDVVTSQFRNFSGYLQWHPEVQNELRKDWQMVARNIEQISQATDPNDPSYNELQGDGLRTNKLTCEAILRKIITWSLKNLHTHQAIEWVLRFLIEYLYLKVPQQNMQRHGEDEVETEISGDWNERDLLEFSQRCSAVARLGAAKLVACVLNLCESASITERAFHLARLMLAEGNKDVQESFCEVFFDLDEGGFFQGIVDMRSTIEESVESAHTLKDAIIKRGTVTAAEASRILLFQRRLGMVNLANVTLKLLCEGHNEKMQKYLRHQQDNAKPYNMLEQTHILLSRLGATLPLVSTIFL